MRSLIALISFVLLLGAQPVAAEQRALLVGVGKYRIPGNNLPAIDLDLDRMQKTLNLMGFEDSQIRRLMDEEATSKNVEKEFRTWLRDGVTSEDRVVFYFSGHGSFIPDRGEDEEDRVDEVLVTHDASFSRWNGKPTLKGVVDDDTLARLIASIPSRNVLTIVDACHSGTVTRSFTPDNGRLGSGEHFEKSLTYEGMPTKGNRRMLTRSMGSSDENFVSMSAAGDGEKAIGTIDGGVFTMGIVKAIEEAARSGSPVSVNDLREASAEFIRVNVDEGRVHSPQVIGNSALASAPLGIVTTQDGNGPNRKKLLELVEETANDFVFTANASQFKIGDVLEFEMTVPINGFLNVVTVDSKDEAIVLFPNRHHGDNEVSTGKFSIPTARMKFELPAGEPIGKTLLVAFVTRDRINFYEQNLDQRDEDGTINVDFSTLSVAATRGFSVAPAGAGKFASKIEVNIVR